MINTLALDLIAESQRRMDGARPQSPDEARAAGPLVGFTEVIAHQNRELKGFLRTYLYQHYQVLRMTNKARRIVTDLFGAFLDDIRLLPPQYQHMARQDRPRAIADYIAGMTDRYAIREHRRLFAVGEIWLA
jgi:dGTPase